MYPPNIIKLAICDDHRIFMEGIKMIIETVDKYKVTGQFYSGNNLLDKIDETEFDILLLDINLGDRSGLDLVKQLKQSHPHIKIIILTMHDDTSFVQRALHAGADGFMHKSVGKKDIYKAIDMVLDGNIFVNASTSKLLLKRASSMKVDQILPHENLSDRELEVLILLGKGATNSEIGTNLHLSPKTIGTYKQRLLKKLHLENNVQIFEYVKEYKLA